MFDFKHSGIAMLFIFRTYTSSNFHPGGPFYKNGYIFLSITAHHTETGDLYLYIYADVHRLETYESEV